MIQGIKRAGGTPPARSFIPQAVEFLTFCCPINDFPVQITGEGRRRAARVREDRVSMRRLYLRDCQAGDVVEDVYVLSGKQLATGQNNKQYIKGFVSDRSAQLVMRFWNATRDIFNALPEAGFLRLRARIENYQNNLQCVVENWWPAT